MPCNKEHLNPTQYEIESKKVAGFILYCNVETGKSTPEWIKEAATNYYGNREKVHGLTAKLCRICNTLPEEILYARNKIARNLANWWEDYQEADQIREEKEAKKQKEKEDRERVIKELTPEQRKALNP